MKSNFTHVCGEQITIPKAFESLLFQILIPTDKNNPIFALHFRDQEEILFDTRKGMLIPAPDFPEFPTRAQLKAFGKELRDHQSSLMGKSDYLQINVTAAAGPMVA